MSSFLKTQRANRRITELLFERDIGLMFNPCRVNPSDFGKDESQYVTYRPAKKRAVFITWGYSTMCSIEKLWTFPSMPVLLYDVSICDN